MLRGVLVQSFNISATYFRTLGLSMLRGREFNDAEAVDPRATDVVIIDEPLAAALYPGQDPLGQMLTLAGKCPRKVHVIGVAQSARHAVRSARIDPPGVKPAPGRVEAPARTGPADGQR